MTDMFVGSAYSGPPPTVSVAFNDPNRAGNTVKVKISDGGDDPRDVEIELDENGHGDLVEEVGTGWLTILMEDCGIVSEAHTIAIP